LSNRRRPINGWCVAADPFELGVAQLLELYGRGETRPSEVIGSLVERMDRCEPSVGAVICRTEEAALRAAEDSARRWASGTARPLEGIPFGLKDIVMTAGVPTTGGSLLYRDLVPAESATVARRLTDAGAILLAKLSVPEFAFGDARPEHEVTNPWDADHWCGGSSSGPAAALAARELPLAIGTDTGGSIRVPGSYCGVTGLKPTRGRVPRTGVMPVSWTLDHTGPMARSALDLALVLTMIAGHDAHDPTSLAAPVEDYAVAVGGDGRGLRIGVPTEWFFDRCDEAVVAAVQRCLDVWTDAGAEVVEVSLPHAHLAPTMAWVITVAEFASIHDDDRDRMGDMTAAAVDRLRAGASISATEYLHALRARHLVQLDFETAFARVDAIVSPGATTPAPRIRPVPDPIFEGGDLAWLEGLARNFLIYNLTGLPALVAPSGFSAEGLPLSVQIAAPPLREHTCLRLAYVLQQATDHHLRQPPATP
jgi:aspartyl-tRNA(Asn)/glutamyl-tRNA(Gln) amidotransferase subunit A